MSKRFPRAKWVLPTVVNPPERICYLIEVPKEQAHIAAFLGALYNLTSAIFWADDDAHTAKSVASIWQDIYDNIVKQSCNKETPSGFGMEDDMPFFREVCENDVCYLEYQCCPGEWIRLANANQLTKPTQLPEHTEQPPAGGGTAQYCVSLPGNGKFPIPVLLNTGDIVHIDIAGGSVNDGTDGVFRCPNGDVYYGNDCSSGTSYLNGADPLPTYPHLAIIINVSGTYYPFVSRTFTVPAGISNAQAWLQVNDSALSNNAGGFDVCVTVTNNQASTWTHTLNFVVSKEGFLPALTGGGIPTSNWVVGTGWEEVQNIGGLGNTDNRIYRSSAAGSTITSVVLSGMADAGQIIYIGDGNSSTNTAFQSGTTPGGAFSLAWSGSQTLVHGLRFDVSITGAIVTSTIVQAIVTGVGTDPFV